MTEKLIVNPSQLSKKLNHLIGEHNQSYQQQLKSKNPFRRLSILVKISCYQKLKHPQFFKELVKFEKKIDNFSTKDKDNFQKKTQFLLEIFSQIQKKLIFHNLSLVFFYKLHPLIIKNQKFTGIFTIEQEKNLYLQKFSQGKIKRRAFDQKFGHYALNAYELATRRFSEYPNTELKTLGQLLTGLKIKTQNSSLQIFENPFFKKEIYHNHLIIREYAKFVSLKIIAILRKLILQQAKMKRIKEPFNKNWTELY